MKKKILALYDSEKDYLDSLAEYLKGREAFPFVLHAAGIWEKGAD